MKTTDEELINAPIRTRGAFQRRDDAAEAPTAPLGTRGGVRTRGPKSAPSPERSPALTLPALIEQLRQQVGDLPLTVLLHGWGEASAAEFWSSLSPLLRRQDAVWLIQAEAPAAAATSAVSEGVVILDLSQAADQRTYRNLISDLVFFPTSAATELTQVPAWQRRANVVVADSRGAHCAEVLERGGQARLVTYRWAGGIELEEGS